MRTKIDEDIRKKEKKLDRSHWMCRIQKYAFNIDAPSFYMGYCPFFWMTWVSVIVAPFILLYKLTIGLVVNWCMEANSKLVEKRSISRKELSKTPLKPSFKQLIELANWFRDDETSLKGVFSCLHYSTRFIDCERIEIWLNQNPDWRDTHLPAAREWAIEEERRKKLALERKQRVRKIGNVASTCGATVFKGIIPVGILVVGYFLYSAILFIVTHIKLQEFVGALAILLSIATLVGVIKLVMSFVMILLDRRNSKKPQYNESGPPEWFTSSIDGISNFYTFIRDTIRMTYKQECPMIIWGEETGKIEKRKKTLEDLG